MAKKKMFQFVLDTSINYVGRELFSCELFTQSENEGIVQRCNAFSICFLTREQVSNQTVCN